MMIIGGRSAAELSRELGVTPWTLRNWKKKHLEAMGQIEVAGEMRDAKDCDQEMMRLRREIADIREQNEILKKAMSIFAARPAANMR